MTAQHALQCLVIAGALGVSGMFADLQLRNNAPQRREELSPPEKEPEPTGRTSAGLPLVFTFWNVEWFPGRRPNASEKAKANHVAAVKPVLARLNPDIIGLEEVSDAASAHLLVDNLPGFRVDVCTQFVRDTGEPTHQQTVLCSRLPLIHAWAESWKPAANGITPRRGFVFGAYQPTPGNILLVYGLHLKSNREDEPGGAATNTAMREESARQLLAHEQAMEAAYSRMGTVKLAVIGGDLNTSLDDPRFERETSLRSWISAGFRWAWETVPLGDRLTLPSEGHYPATCFDHLFLRGSGEVLTAGIEPTGKDASDHRPVTVTIVW